MANRVKKGGAGKRWTPKGYDAEWTRFPGKHPELSQNLLTRQQRRQNKKQGQFIEEE
jgi:hypothetical protein